MCWNKLKKAGAKVLERSLAMLGRHLIGLILGVAIGFVAMSSPVYAASTPTGSVPTLFEQGLVQFNAGDYQAALAQFSQAIEVNPQFAAAYSARCLTNVQLEAYQSAIEDCTQALNLQPQNLEAYLNRGVAYARLGNYHAAIDDNDRLLAIAPHDFRAYYNRALARSSLGETRQAIQDFNQALHWGIQAQKSTLPDSSLAEIYDDRGLAYLMLADLPGAIADFTQAIHLNANDSRALHNRGCACEQQGNYKAAIADFTRSLHLNPTNAEAYFNRAIAHHELGEDTAALQDLQQAADYFLAQGQQAAYGRSVTLLRQLRRSTEPIVAAISLFLPV